MSLQPKISVVVPIYGVEKYLNQCVDSIINQTLNDIEIILVDDGSKDKCPQIVDEYAAKDSRVVAIHQPNGGYGRAVNHGIEVATGEYIGIIESDDWIEPTMYEKLYASAKQYNTDITKGEFYAYNSQATDGQCDKLWKSRHQDLDDAPDGVFSIADYPLFLAFHASIWSSIYRADFIKTQKVSETRSASYQDFPFMVEAVCRAERISVVKEPLVHYRMEENQNSSTIRRDERLVLMPIQCAEGKRLLKEYGKYDFTEGRILLPLLPCLHRILSFDLPMLPQEIFQ
jgi:glycosyltransferase involved in cell wall biosynthesis